MFIKLAARTLVRHKKRSILIIFAVMISVLVMEVVAGMFYGIRVNFYRNLGMESGHILITAEGRHKSLNPLSLGFRIGNYRSITAALNNMPEIEKAEPVLTFGGILSSGSRSLTLAGLGLESDSGLYPNVKTSLEFNTFPPEPGSILVSEAAAELLHMTESEILLVVEDSTGSPFYMAFDKAELFSSPSGEFDTSYFFINHSEAEELLYLDGATMEIRIFLHAPETADSFTEILNGRLGSAASGLDIQSFSEVNKGIVSLIEMMDFFALFMNLFVVIVAATVITNAILMNVFDRIREFGTIRAIGLKRRGITALIMTEGAVLGVAGSILGLAAGIPLVLYFSANGIPMGGITEAFGMGSGDFLFGYTIRNSLINAASGIAIALGGSLYAAVTGSRLSIMEALSYE